MSVSVLTPSFDAPADVTRSPIEGSLAHDLASATTTAALTFAGQGWRWWEDLDALLARRPWLRDRARRWSDRVVELSSKPALVDLAALRHGFDPLRWIDDPRTRPDEGELSALAVSMPGVLLTQLLAYREAWEDGLSRAVEAGSVVAATGHSGGIIAAAAVAARPDGLDDEAAVSSFLELAVVLGHVVGTSEHAVPASGLTSELQGDVDARTPMVAVAGVRLDRLAELLDADDAPGAARIALRHSHSRAVISGSPAGLEIARAALAAAVRADPGGGRLVWEPLAVSAPCHHPVLAGVAEAVVATAHEAGVVLPGATSDIALVLPDGPRVAPADGDLVRELVEVMLVRPGTPVVPSSSSCRCVVRCTGWPSRPVGDRGGRSARSDRVPNGSTSSSNRSTRPRWSSPSADAPPACSCTAATARWWSTSRARCTASPRPRSASSRRPVRRWWSRSVSTSATPSMPAHGWGRWSR